MEGGIHYSYPHSRQALPQGLPVSNKGWINSGLLPDLAACSHNLRVGEKTHSIISGPGLPMWSTLIHGYDEGAGLGISHTENFAPLPTLVGFEGLQAVRDEDTRLADVNPSHYLQQEGASMKAPSDQSHQYIVGTAPNLPLASAIPMPSVVQRASRNRSHPSNKNKTRRKRTEESSQSSSGQHNGRQALERPYACDMCGESYKQPQGVMRHYRAKHDPNSCMYCDAKWSRPYQYRDHLKKHHHDVDPDLVLGKPPGSRRRTAVTGRGQSQKHSPPVIQLHRESQAAPRCPPLTSPLPAATRVTQAPPAYSSTKELAQPINGAVDHTSRLPPAHVGGSTAANCSSSPRRALIPTLSPPVRGYYGNGVSVDRMFEPSRFIDAPSFSAGYDDTWTMDKHVHL